MQKKLLNSVLFMLVSPALALIEGLKSQDIRFKKWLLIIFITIYGSIIILNIENDGYRHWENVYIHYVDLSFSQFSSELYNIILQKHNAETNKDVYIHVLSYLTGGILRMPWSFFVFVSFIYAYFYVNSIFKLLTVTKAKKLNKLLIFLVMAFILWKNIEGINTVRTWTGLWVLFYGAISYFQSRKLKYLLLMAAPPLIHVGYFVMIIPVWIVVIFKSRPLLYSIIFAASFISPVINQTSVLKHLSKTEVGEAEVKGYYRENGVTYEDFRENNKNTAWYLNTQKMGVQDWGINIAAGVLILFGCYFRKMTPLEGGLFSAGILTQALSNSTYFIYALSNRSAIIAAVFILAAIILVLRRGYLENQKLPYRKWQLYGLLLACLVMVPYMIYQIAGLIYFVSVFMLFLPFIPWFVNDINISIRQAITALTGF